jgi:hypothetical protein
MTLATVSRPTLDRGIEYENGGPRLVYFSARIRNRDDARLAGMDCAATLGPGTSHGLPEAAGSILPICPPRRRRLLTDRDLGDGSLLTV